MSGFYLAIEGGEGAGKTTVGTLLSQALTERGEQVVSVREPGSTDLGPRGSAAAPALAGHDSLGRGDAVRSSAGPGGGGDGRSRSGPGQLRDNSDRSLYSSLAYQGAARGLGIEPVRIVNELAVGGIVPDLVVVLMVDTATGLSRQGDPDRIGGETDRFSPGCP